MTLNSPNLWSANFIFSELIAWELARTYLKHQQQKCSPCFDDIITFVRMMGDLLQMWRYANMQ